MRKECNMFNVEDQRGNEDLLFAGSVDECSVELRVVFEFASSDERIDEYP